MADGARLLARRLDVDGGPVLHVLLRKIEDVARGVVGADAGEGARARTLQDVDAGMALAQPRASPLRVFHFQAEVIEPGRAARLARIDVQSHVTVADRDRALRAGVGRGLHAEHGLVEPALQGVLVADDGDVLDLRGHGSTTSRKYFPEF